MRTAVLFLLAAGCGFHSVGNGDASVNDDMGASNDDLGNADDLYGIPPGSDLAMTSGGSCAPPVLLVGVENLHNGDTGGGRVARLSLTASGAKQCTTLRGQGLIGPQPLAVAEFSGGVGAAAIDALYIVNPMNDTVVFSKPAPMVSGWLPIDALNLMSPTGTPILAVAYGMAGNPSTIREIDAFDDQGNAVPASKPWCIQGTGCTALPLSLCILSITATPTDLTHFMALDCSTPAAALDVDPWTPAKTTYVGTYLGQLTSVYSVVVGHPGPARFAWLDQSDATGTIKYVSDSGSGPSAMGGPIKCASGCTTLLHVVPDPTTLDGYFALCDGATVDARTVVRIDGALKCTTVLDGKPFGAESRLSHLGIWQ